MHAEQRFMQFGLSSHRYRLWHSLRFTHRFGTRYGADLSLKVDRERISLEMVDVLFSSFEAICLRETLCLSQCSMSRRCASVKCLFLVMTIPSVFFARHKYLSSKKRSFARLNAPAPPRGSRSWSFPVCLIKCNLLLCQIKCNH